MLSGKISKNLINRKKLGFNPPLDNEINNLEYDKIFEMFESIGLFQILDRNTVNGIVNDHFMGIRNNSYKIYQLLHLGFWINQNKL